MNPNSDPSQAPTEPVNPTETVDVDLDDFSQEFFSNGKPTDPVESPSDETPPIEDTPDTKGDPEVNEEADNNEADLDPEDDPQDEPEPPKKKSRFQERIDQLSERARIERERADALETRLRALEETKNKAPEPKVEPEDRTPSPDDLNEDGTDKYPLGEFDPEYSRDLIKHTLKQEREAYRKELEQERRQEEQAKAQQALEQEWAEKLAPAQERYPDFQERGQDLVEALEGMDEAYGEYLTTTIQQMDHGPDVLYYLASNVEEAKRISNLGPRGATLALGRIEAQFANLEKQVNETPKVKPKVSSAPPPPPRNRGSDVGRPDIPGDTDDLDAFEAEFFKKARRY